MAGNARAIGADWGAKVRRVRFGAQWPEWSTSDRVRELARAKVRHLASGDAALLDHLAQECAAHAAAEYRTPSVAPGGIAFRVGQPHR
jgi:hypothetical protein